MFRRVAPHILFALSALLLGSCLEDCSCNSTPGQCSLDTDCNGRSWTLNECDEADGHWECHDAYCLETCNPPCQVATDCETAAWRASYAGCEKEDGYWACENDICVPQCNGPGCSEPEDCSDAAWPPFASCPADQGHWECPTGNCKAICDESECSDYGDCSGLSWPLQELDCEEAQGHWECTAGACVAACNLECDQDDQCQAFDWNAACGGNWDCIQGLCEPVCDPIGCSDGTCDAAAGETTASCPADCAIFCDVDADCVDSGELWQLPCAGRWLCDTTCSASCDYATCGDETCDPSVGEDAASCPADCLETCQWPIDCTYQDWSLICQGRHTCLLGNCQQTCDSNGCGNGTCDGALGETEDSCFIDCLGGPCSDTIDCLGRRWYENSCPGAGHWSCTQPAGACEAVCDNVNCGDGICDVLAGEAAAACPADCQAYDCNLSSDCDALTLPQGCSDWLCVRRNCSPVCP